MVEMALQSFHRDQEIFRDSGVCPSGFSLPCQHSLMHYRHLIQQFGAPNGLCSFITESKHIVAVKKPWCRSNKYKALGQMLLANQHMDKLAAMNIHIQTIGTDRQQGMEGGEGEESDEDEESEQDKEGEQDEEGQEDEEDEMSGVDDGPHSWRSVLGKDSWYVSLSLIIDWILTLCMLQLVATLDHPMSLVKKLDTVIFFHAFDASSMIS
jgi:hypothetical protein